MTRFVVLDTETTGFRDADEIVELAWVEIDQDGEVVRAHASLIDPEIPIPPDASAVHGITDEDVADSPTMAEYLTTASHPFDCDDVIPFAHNWPFDRRFLIKHIPTLDRGACTVRLARVIYPDTPNHKLQTLRQVLNLSVEGEAHRAAGDVSVLLALINRMRQDTGLGLFDLFELSNEPFPVTQMPFGKHKGMPLTELPPGYVTWLLSLPNLSDDLRHALNNMR